LISNEFVESERIYPEDGWRSPKLYEYDRGRKATCTMEVDGEMKDIDILSLSPKFMTEMEKGSMSIYDYPRYLSYLEQSFFHNGDYLIAQIQESRNTSCRRINLNSAIGDDVSYKGYPAASRGRGVRNSDGKSLLKSEGKVTESIRFNECIIASNPNNIEKLSVIYDRDEIILSSVDILPGASGSSLLNHKGEIIGLLNSTYTKGVDMYEKYCEGSAVAVRMNHILELAKKHLSSMELKEVFSCN